MYHMLSCFNLKPGISIEAFQRALVAFGEHMQQMGHLEDIGPVGRRDDSTPMDTDTERNLQYYFVTRFQDKAQCDGSYAYILRHEPVADRLHDAVYHKVLDPVFICFDDLPAATD